MLSHDIDNLVVSIPSAAAVTGISSVDVSTPASKRDRFAGGKR
jgi:hypothetical protein